MVKGIQETARILAAAGASEVWSFHSRPATARAEARSISDRALSSFFDEVEKKGVQSNGILMGSAHIMGSCRMSADEAKGATNPRGELYGVENLFIGDASVFPTAPGVNPMITIMSMARRTAESIKATLRSA
jgi:long-chain-alcohol oxidase